MLAPTLDGTRIRTTDQDYDRAFAATYQAYYTKVFSFVYSRVEDVETVKDLVAETFARAYAKGRGLRNPEAFNSWLFIIARNLIAGHFRRLKREYTAIDRVTNSLSLADEYVAEDDRLQRSEMIRALLQQIRSLSPRDQELLSLKFDAELTYAEISQIMGISEVNARVSLLRALRRLRDRFEEAEAAA